MQSEATFHGRRQVEVVNWFHEMGIRAQSRGQTQLSGIFFCGADDDFEIRAGLADTAQGAQPVQAGHLQIEQHDVGIESLIQAAQRFQPIRGSLYLIAIQFEKQPQVAAHVGRIINHQNRGGIRLRRSY